MISKFKKNIFIWVGISSIFYLAFVIYADLHSVLFILKSINPIIFLELLLLSFANYLFRFFKWHYYLNLLKIKIAIIDSFAIFMSGLVMTITPGKMGEIFKAYLLKNKTETPLAQTLPVILSERITDFLAIIFLSLLGAFLFDYDKILLISSASLFLILIGIIGSEKLSLKIIRAVSRIKIFRKYSGSLVDAYKSASILLKFKSLISMLILSIAAWFFECFGFYLILRNFETDISVFWATFVYAFATIVGALSMLPAGLGVTDGSLTYFIIQMGLSERIAITSTLLIRVVTLWFAVFIGAISILIFRNRFNQK